MKYPFLIIEKSKYENLYYLITDEDSHKKAYLTILKNKLDNWYITQNDEDFKKAKNAIKEQNAAVAYRIVESRFCDEYETVIQTCFTNV